MKKVKPTQPAPEQQIEWTRADPAALAAFDPNTKTCTMNCSPLASDPRSRAERLFLCDDCECHPVAQQKASGMNNDLLPCPYCGGPPTVSSFPGAHNVWCSNQPVKCGNRSMFTPEQWNRRTPAITPDVKTGIR